MKCVAGRINGGGPPWAHKAGGAPRGVGRALHPRGQVDAPLLCSQCQIFQKKSYLNFRAFGEFYFWGIFLLHG